MSRRLSRARALSFAVLASLLGLLAVEACAGGVLRVATFAPPASPSWLTSQRTGFAAGTYVPDPHTIWLLQPGIVAPTTDRLFWGPGPLEVNELGMRGPSVPMKKPAGTRRILVVGGSHPMGMFVEERGTYARALERRLNRRPGPRWEVLNASVAGHTTWQGLQCVLHHGLKLEPDIVIFDLGINDDLPLSLDYAVPDHEVTAVGGPVREALRLAELSAAAFLVRRALAPLRRPEPGAVRVPRERGLQNLADIGRLGRDEGFEVLYMEQVALLDRPGEGAATECVRSYDGFEPRVRLCERFAALGPSAEGYFADLIHANEGGHALIADAILETLDAAGWTAP